MIDNEFLPYKAAQHPIEKLPFSKQYGIHPRAKTTGLSAFFL
ncbi:MAG: hypothetical protein ACE5OZ_18120 [Candidatus Heimdallarchaeota archaeon]